MTYCWSEFIKNIEFVNGKKNRAVKALVTLIGTTLLAANTVVIN